MSINCVQKFNDENTIIRFLQANNPFTGTISSRFDGAFFKFEMTEFETIYFTLRLTPNTPFAINVQFTLYRKDGEDFTNLGSSLSDDFYNTFEYAATPAEYYICITSDWSIDYNLTADFTDFPFILIADCEAAHGSHMPPVEFARPEAVCDSPVFYQIIEGSLPRGLHFGADGVIYGTPEEQDCEPLSDEKVLPSFMWWEELPKEHPDDPPKRTSTGYEHRIVVRAALVDAPETYDDREFFICVRNNWDYDRDAFMRSKPNWETEVFEVKGEESWLKPEPKPEPVKELPTLELLCEPCPEPEEPKQATLEQIKELTKQVYIAPEFRDLIKINDEGLCEVCEEEAPVDVKVELEEIPLTDFCVPCPEPVIVEGLQPIPASLCPVCVEPIIFEEKEPDFVPGIPERCYPDLLNAMMTQKVCHDGNPIYHECPDTYPIYPEVEQVNPNILPKTLCDKECD